MVASEAKAVLKFPVTVERTTRKNLNPESMKEQLQFIASSATRNRAANWQTSIPAKLINRVETGEGEDRQIKYSAVIYIVKERYKDPAAVTSRFAGLMKVLVRAAKRVKWNVISDEAVRVTPTGHEAVNGANEPTGDPAPRLLSQLPVNRKELFANIPDELELPPLTDEVMKKYFGRIYDREAHIRIIYDNLKTAVKTKFKTRHHILLKGPPACAKTELFLSFIDWLGDDLIEAVDASTMTKAGLERLLLEKSQSGDLKPILVFEEIEKCHPENISCLIQVMDSRGKIQRVNANTVRDGDGTADCKIIVWGTCNDEQELMKFHSGAIHSRFGIQPECERPDRTLMERILEREVVEIDGDRAWIEPVLGFCFEELQKKSKFKDKYNDPRFARSLLAGGARLLDTGPTGFFADFRKVSKLGEVIVTSAPDSFVSGRGDSNSQEDRT
jgi:hypothetical protein